MNCDHDFPQRDGRCVGCQEYVEPPPEWAASVIEAVQASAYRYREGHTEDCRAYHRLNSALVPCTCGGKEWWRAARGAYERAEREQMNATH